MAASERKAFFDENGYWVAENLIPKEELLEIRQMIDGVLDGTVKPQWPVLIGKSPDDFHIQWEPGVQDDPSVPRCEKIRVVFHLCRTHPFFWRHATRPEIVDVAEELIGPNLRLYTDQMFVKPPRHGSAVPLHQDAGYWPITPPNMLSCWFAVDDSTEENGCVRVIPGTHNRLLPHHQMEGPNSLGLLEEEVDLKREVPVTIKAGGAMFHHACLIHHSLPNLSDQRRRGLVTIYMPADIQFTKPWNFKYGFPMLRGREPEGRAHEFAPKP